MQYSNTLDIRGLINNSASENEIVTDHRFGTTVFDFRDRYYVAVPETNRNIIVLHNQFKKFTQYNRN